MSNIPSNVRLENEVLQQWIGNFDGQRQHPIYRLLIELRERRASETDGKGYCRRCDARHNRVYCPDCGLKLIPAAGSQMEPAEELYAPVLLCRTCGARKDAGEHFKNCAEIRSALKARESSPDQLVGALQDSVHQDIGRVRPGSAVNGEALP